MKRVPRCLALHDLSCFGRCALTVVAPVLAVQGIQPCPLPTALLSTHSGVFTDYTFLDLTEEMGRILAHWQNLGLSFESLYTGFLGSAQQVQIVEKALDFLRPDGGFYLFDPVLGDDGELYSSLRPEMVDAMRSLMPKADILTPNLTELFLLTGEPFQPQVCSAKIDQMLQKLAFQGPQKIVVTSCPNDLDGDFVHARVWDQGRIYSLYAPATAATFPGTGDLFASVLLGQVTQRKCFAEAVQKAMDFVALVLRESAACADPWHFGLQFEAFLGFLRPDEAGHDIIEG